MFHGRRLQQKSSEGRKVESYTRNVNNWCKMEKSWVMMMHQTDKADEELEESLFHE